MLAYKIVEKEKNGDIKTLFHGLNGSKIMPMNEWITADMKEVYDGSDGTRYISGFHVLFSLEKTKKYLSKFKTRLDKLAIVKCEVENLRPKEHSREDVWLAERIKFLED